MRTLFALSTWLLMGAVHAAPWIESSYTQPGQGKAQLTIYGTHDLDAIQSVLDAFVAASGIGLTYHTANSRALHEQVALPRRPGTDLVFSSATGLQVKAVNDGWATALDGIAPSPTQWRNRLFQVSIEPIVAVYDRARSPWMGRTKSRAQLTEQLKYEAATGRTSVAVYNPAVSGLGYLLATQDSEQTPTFWPLIDQFRALGMREFCCSADMLDAVEQGSSLLAYNVLESYAAKRMLANRNLAMVTFQDYQLVVPRTLWVPSWSTQPQLAQQFIEFMRADDGQALLPARNRLEQLNNTQAAPLKPIRLSPALILYLDDFKRQRFMRRWTPGAVDEG